ncbi:MAG: glutamate 5-kinase [Pseudomonadota bacterium]
MTIKISATLKNRKRIVVKIGSSLLIKDQKLNAEWLKILCHDLAVLYRNHIDLIIVSSGAVALGGPFMSPHPACSKERGRWPLEIKQAASSVGQISLISGWSKAFEQYELKISQILLTLFDTEERHRHLNARATLIALLKAGIIPMINENDTVAIDRIRYGDNDRLAARVATMISADLLILLSNVEGLYSSDPSKSKKSKLLEVIETITPEIESMAGQSVSETGTGGMATKIEAARIATSSGCEMILANGQDPNILSKLDHTKHSLFKATMIPLQARKRWIAGSLNPTGKLYLDQGAVNAVQSGKSLLAAGVLTIEGQFKRGDSVILMDAKHKKRFATAIIGYSADEATKIIGHKSHQIKALLGYSYQSELVHRDNLVLDESLSMD